MNPLERFKYRKAAYEAWLESGEDKERAEQILRERYAGIDPATIAMILSFALKLFQWWIDHKKKPESFVCQDEARAFNMEDAD